MSNFDFDAIKALLIIAGFLLLIVVMPLAERDRIASQCDDFGRMKAGGHVYTCERMK